MEESGDKKAPCGTGNEQNLGKMARNGRRLGKGRNYEAITSGIGPKEALKGSYTRESVIQENSGARERRDHFDKELLGSSISDSIPFKTTADY